MAAGLTMETVQQLAGAPYPVIRIMPNTPASIGMGMILSCDTGVSQEETAEFCTLLSGAGRLDALPESLIDAGSAISGLRPRLRLPLPGGPGRRRRGLRTAPGQGTRNMPLKRWQRC